jgi:hypothetical protein
VFGPLRPHKGTGSPTTSLTRKGSLFGGQGSFPSGHTITLSPFASIFANRCPRHRWVLAYVLAASVAFSRVTLQAHTLRQTYSRVPCWATLSAAALPNNHRAPKEDSTKTRPFELKL